jgi:hypothetical protein
MDHLRLRFPLPQPRTLRAVALSFTGLCFTCVGVTATPLLRCHVSYAGTTHTIEAKPVADPYPVPSVDIGGRFRFKAVMVGDVDRVDRVVLYTYLDSKQQPILVHQAKYLPPFDLTQTPLLLTGDQFVFAGPVERELQYRCTLEGKRT